jgi:uncharacterized cupredoxin-like copper-binding protein
MLDISRRILFTGFGAAGIGLALATTSARAQGGGMVKVELWDKGANAMDKLGTEPMRGVGMPGAALPARTMGITATPASIQAGEITFEAINNSKALVHEMIVASLKDPTKPLPYIADEQRVDEEKGEHLGEVSELAPGAKGALRITLKPGRYLLYCNVPGHYAMGMWTEVTVTA